MASPVFVSFIVTDYSTPLTVMITSLSADFKTFHLPNLIWKGDDFKIMSFYSTTITSIQSCKLDKEINYKIVPKNLKVFARKFFLSGKQR